MSDRSELPKKPAMVCYCGKCGTGNGPWVLIRNSAGTSRFCEKCMAVLVVGALQQLLDEQEREQAAVSEVAEKWVGRVQEQIVASARKLAKDGRP